MSTVIEFLRIYPARSALMLICLVVAGTAEGLSLTALLPMLSVAAGGGSTGEMGEFVLKGLAWAQIQPTIGALLLIIVAGIILKSGLLLVANRQVGYTVARVATDFRITLINALLACEWQYFMGGDTSVDRTWIIVGHVDALDDARRAPSWCWPDGIDESVIILPHRCAAIGEATKSDVARLRGTGLIAATNRRP